MEYCKIFLEKIFEYEKFMAKYDGEQMERIAPNLPENNKEIILITYDKCIFYSNDGKRGV